ncbi:HEAT repeat domain-containing protein [Pedosphaera parvula]|uniref:PBS lyase HEAT domain protein repeat-containing protein n=1 Tax=Pedosphaera parvula (strain Ellin514) TaxID=320771 RepID=B9XH25_PEDPL|nr:HEAT repeat domain-containing protein [Pedosphaera parvula]EEF60946.1 PBS lyase HEAT domain protein repeat-containing protein [Pedosphaera parvula Ellin514]
MKHPRRILLILLSFLLLGGLAWQVLRPREPVYQGKTLTQWLRQGIGSTNAEDEKLIVKAVTIIGTNALPVLLQKIQATDSPLKLKFISLIERQSLIQLDLPTAYESRCEAFGGFFILGPLANPAVPKLAELLPYDDDSGFVAFSLAGIGLDGALPLVQALTNSNPGVKHNALEAFGLMRSLYSGTNYAPDRLAAIPEVGKIAVRPLLECLESKDRLARGEAARALGSLGCEPDQVVPALIHQLKGTNYSSRPALEALGMFGPKAKAAVPALLEALNGPTFGDRSELTNTLKKIDPAAAARAGVK